MSKGTRFLLLFFIGYGLLSGVMAFSYYQEYEQNRRESIQIKGFFKNFHQLKTLAPDSLSELMLEYSLPEGLRVERKKFILTKDLKDQISDSGNIMLMYNRNTGDVYLLKDEILPLMKAKKCSYHAAFGFFVVILVLTFF